MGWNTWSMFQHQINYQLIVETIDAVLEKGLDKAGYKYIVIDDCYQQSERDPNTLQIVPDQQKFKQGQLEQLEQYIHQKQLKFGMYSCAGIYTCGGYPGSFGYEDIDANQFILQYKIDFLKYDFCYNPFNLFYNYKNYNNGDTYQQINYYNTVVLKTLKLTNNDEIVELCDTQFLQKHDYTTTLDNNLINFGISEKVIQNQQIYLEFEITLKQIHSHIQLVIDYDIHWFQRNYNILHFQFLSIFLNRTLKFNILIQDMEQGQIIIHLNEHHTDQLFKANNHKFKIQITQQLDKLETAHYSYYRMAEQLQKYDREVIFNICEWGTNSPEKWAQQIGHSFRTTVDINYQPGIADYDNVLRMYDRTLLKKNQKAICDPDMLCVGLKHMTFLQNQSHFSIWCILQAPLMLGCDIRNLDKQSLQIITNKHCINVNQSDDQSSCELLFRSEKLDVLIKKMGFDEFAILFLNRSFQTIEQFEYSLQNCFLQNSDFSRIDFYDVWNQQNGMVLKLQDKFQLRVHKLESCQCQLIVCKCAIE